jgi:hypothetical protein
MARLFGGAVRVSDRTADSFAWIEGTLPSGRLVRIGLYQTLMRRPGSGIDWAMVLYGRVGKAVAGSRPGSYLFHGCTARLRLSLAKFQIRKSGQEVIRRFMWNRRNSNVREDLKNNPYVWVSSGRKRVRLNLLPGITV